MNIEHPCCCQNKEGAVGGLGGRHNMKLERNQLLSQNIIPLHQYFFTCLLTLFVESFVMQTFIIFVQKSLSIFSFINSRFCILGKPSNIQIKNIFFDIFFKDLKNFVFYLKLSSHLELIFFCTKSRKEGSLSLSLCLFVSQFSFSVTRCLCD